MGTTLEIIFGARGPHISLGFRQLETAAAHSGVDSRLIGDMIARSHEIMHQLGLDPRDSSAEELYYALSSLSDDPVVVAGVPYLAAVIDGEPVSFNYDDILENRRRSFAERQLTHVRRELLEEIERRYKAHPQTHGPLIEDIIGRSGLRQHAAAPASKSARPPQAAAPDTPTLLMIGDIFTDAFIELDESTSKIIKEKDGKEWLALPFGQKPPYEKVDIIKSVGPSPNAAVSAARLGLNASLMAWVGDDPTGEEALEHLRAENVGTDAMVVEKNKLTSYWYVLRYGSDRTMLVKSEQYAYAWQPPKVQPDWIYLSYIGKDSWPLHQALSDYLDKNPDIKLAFQPGTFHFQWGTKKLAKLYKRTEIVVMNREEAVEVTGKSYNSLADLSAALHALGPNIVVITDGPNGSYASYAGRLVTIPNYPDPKAPLDRTGAGDAFASTIVAALALGKSMDEALTWAPINSMNVVQHLGAQAGLLTQNKIRTLLKKAPKNYKVRDYSPGKTKGKNK